MKLHQPTYNNNKTIEEYDLEKEIEEKGE